MRPALRPQALDRRQSCLGRETLVRIGATLSKSDRRESLHNCGRRLDHLTDRLFRDAVPPKPFPDRQHSETVADESTQSSLRAFLDSALTKAT